MAFFPRLVITVFYPWEYCVLAFIRSNRKCFMSDVGVNGLYTILAYSLPRYDLRSHVECKYTIVQLNTRYNVLVNQVFANPVSVFILLGFSS